MIDLCVICQWPVVQGAGGVWVHRNDYPPFQPDGEDVDPHEAYWNSPELQADQARLNAEADLMATQQRQPSAWGSWTESQ